MVKLEELEPNRSINTITYKCDSDGCGYIRTVLPCESMNSWRYKQMTFNFLHSQRFINQPSLYNHVSFVKFQRSATKEQLGLIKYFINNIKSQTGTPILYESDDNLFNIPKSNYAHEYYNKNKQYIEEMLSIVDGITVSTPFLKKSYQKYNKNISVVKNRLCKYVWGDVNIRNNFENVGDKIKILYPGSQNHFSCDPKLKGGDIGSELMNFIQKTTDKYEWIFVGGIPQELKSYADEGKITFIKWVNILDYPLFMKNFKADIAIAPLELNNFNRSKSNLKMLEYSICGLPAVYTDIEPYKFAKNTAETDEWFIHLIEMLASNPDLRKKSWLHDYNVIKSNLYFENNRKNWLNEHLKLFNKKVK